MRRGVAITFAKEEQIIAALEADPHASRIARKLGVSFATVWRRADWAGIELKAGREAKGYERLAPDHEVKINRGCAGKSGSDTARIGTCNGCEPFDRGQEGARK